MNDLSRPKVPPLIQNDNNCINFFDCFHCFFSYVYLGMGMGKIEDCSS